MTDEVDVISVQLQQILKVPRIETRKAENVPKVPMDSDCMKALMDTRSFTCVPQSVINTTGYNTKDSASLLLDSFGQGQGEVHKGHSHNGRQHGVTKAATTTTSQLNHKIPPLRPTPSSILGGPPPSVMLMSAPRLINQQLNRLGGSQSHPRQQNVQSPPQYSYMVRNSPPKHSGRNFEAVNGNNQQRPRSKVISHMQELLRNKNCPANLVQLTDKLIAASLEEHKPMYHLNLDKEVLYVFGLHCIEPLTSRSLKFAKAKYFCYICNYHMDNITNVISHASNARHQSNAQEHELDLDVKNIPFPTENHITNLGFLVQTVMTNDGIDEFERNLRVGVLDKLNQALEPHDLKLELFGSSVSGFGFKSSDINLNLDLTSKQTATGEAMTGAEHIAKVAQLARVLENFSFVRDVTEGQHSLELKFKDTDVDRNCSVQVNNVAGMMLAQLFEQYNRLDERVRFLVVAFRFWARQTGVDDQEQGYLPGHAFTVMALKHLIDVGVLPFIILPENASQNYRTFFMHGSNFFMYWRSENRETLGSLWIGLLRKYSLEFNFKENVISLVQKELLKSEDKIWNRKISIEDPIIPRSNLCRNASTNRVFDYILHTIKVAFKYFGLAKVKGGTPVFDKIIPIRLVRDPSKIFFYDEAGPPKIVDKDRLLEVYNEHTFEELQKLNAEPFIVRKMRFIKLPDYSGSKAYLHIIAEDLPLLDRYFLPCDYFFKFERAICQNGEEPPKHCKSCGKDDHVKMHCPEEILPTFSPVALPEDTTLQVLSSVMRNVYGLRCLTESCNNDRAALVRDLYDHLLGHFPDVELMLFGSTANGFGLRGSDVDVSVRFDRHPIEKANFHSAETAELLQSMVQMLRSKGSMQEVFAIPTAKVPIIKFKHKPTGLECDLSLYNVLPIRNTRLLRAYSNVDQRVKILGCFLKQLTKICDIGDASKGSLSSYAYSLMLIHFLQQLPVPVLPVLQEIPMDDKPVCAQDGWDTYFFSDLDSLPVHWEHFGRNHDSEAMLLLNFFRYYTEVFNYEVHVINISQLAPLSRKEARFTASTLICIEDPFEKSHNLGAGLTRRMSVFIIKTLERFRRIFSRSIPNFSPEIDYRSFFLDPAVIRSDFNPPVDRQCRICNKIGHFANSCAFRNSSDDRDDDAEGDGELADQEVPMTGDLSVDQI